MATLVVTDNADGTGGNAAISGGGASDVHSLYRAPWDGNMEGLSWTLHGSRTGDGSIAISSPFPVALGHYVWQVLTVPAVGPATLTNLYYRSLTDATVETLHLRILNAVKTRLQALNMSGIDAAKIQVQWFPMEIKDVNAMPLILLSPAGTPTFPHRVTNRDDRGFPVLITVLDDVQFQSAKNMGRDLKWVDQIGRALRFQRLAGVDEVFQCEEVPAPVVSPEWLQLGKLASFLSFRFLVRQSRGLTT